MRIHEILVEGGNVFKGEYSTIRIAKDLVRPTVAWLETITGFPLLGNMLGSTGLKETSGDIDLGIDASKYNKDELVNTLKSWSAKNDPTAFVKKVGTSVTFRCPIAGDPKLNYVQCDCMFLDDIKFAKWVMRADPNSKFKNQTRTILIASLSKAMGLKFSYTRGLLNRESDTPIKNGTNPLKIARTILNPDASIDDLRSVESILSSINKDPNREQKLADARETLAKEGIII
jgi:hypothetical protein